ncbi:MAG: putative toxin-antitoxin system toxin component, PIN family [Rhodothermales bacterium]
MRVFLDTNVLISAFTTRGICADVLTVVLAEHELVVGEAVLKELARVLRQKMKIPMVTVEEATSFLREEGIVVSAESIPGLSAIRDPDDRQVVAEAMAGTADLLVSGDRDLLDVAGELPVEVVSPRGFWEELQGRR